MLTTHNLRLLNPEISQTPLCQELTCDVPRNFICSATVDLRKFAWPNIDSNPVEDQYLERVNQHFYNHRKMPDEVHRQTELIDPLLHNLYLYMGEAGKGSFTAISPAPCCGIFHEIILRESENQNVSLSSQMIEVKQERLSQHGSMVAYHGGSIKSFLLPYLEAPSKIEYTQKEDNYIILEFGMDGFSVSTGMVGIGLPPVSVFGIFISNFLQKDLLVDGDVKFAIGVHDLHANKKPVQNTPYTKPNRQQNTVRKSNIQGYLVLKPNSDEQAKKLIERLSQDIRIGGVRLSHKRVIVGNTTPSAFWLKDMDDDIDSILNLDPGADALDAAFDFVEDGRLSVPVAVGFALLNKPELKPHMPMLKYPHAWAEVLFKSTELVYGALNSKYFYQRKGNQDIVYWSQK